MLYFAVGKQRTKDAISAAQKVTSIEDIDEDTLMGADSEDSEDSKTSSNAHDDATAGVVARDKLPTQGELDSKLLAQQDDKEGLKHFVQSYAMVVLFLVFPGTTNIIFTMLRSCRHFISPLPHGSSYMWNDYSIQVMI